MPGVDSVTVNFAAGSATVRYDETRLKVVDIKSAVRQSGYEAAASGGASSDDSHEGHAAPGTSPAAVAPATPPVGPVPSAPKAVPDADGALPAGDAQK